MITELKQEKAQLSQRLHELIVSLNGYAVEGAIPNPQQVSSTRSQFATTQIRLQAINREIAEFGRLSTEARLLVAAETARYEKEHGSED